MSIGVKNIAVIGGDVHAWSAATRLSAALRHGGVNVSIVIPTQGEEVVGITAFNTSVHEFHAAIGVKESDLVKHVGGSYRYGSIYQNWNNDGSDDFIFTYSPSGQMIERVPFHHYLARAKQLALESELESFSIAAMAARAMRFTHPEPNTPFSQLDYSLNVDSRAYLELLKNLAAKNGVQQVTSDLEQVNRDSDSGLVQSLSLSNGTTLTVDFCFDCLKTAPINSSEFRSWSHWVPVDRKIQVFSESSDGTALLSSLVKNDVGWTHTHNAPGVRFATHHYQQAAARDDQILTSIRQQLGSSRAAQPAISDQTIGVREHFWNRNCVALGAAAGNPVELEFGQLHFTHTALSRWLTLFPDAQHSPQLAQDYNRTTEIEYYRVRDVHLLRLATINKPWSFCTPANETVWPDSLQHRIELFRATGRVAFYEADVLEKHQWVTMLMGCGVLPERYDPLVDAASDDQLEQQLNAMRNGIKALIEKLPNHDALLTAIRAS